MVTKLRDIKVDRVSLVKKPATRQYFLLRKAVDVDEELNVEELAKALHHHFDAIMQLVGADEDMKKKVEQIAELMDEGGDQAASRLSGFLWTLRDMKSMLESTLGKEDEGDDDDDDDEEVEWDEDDYIVAKRELTAATRGKIPRSQFAWVDEDGKGHLPIHDKAHVQNAMARWNQTKFPSAVIKARAKSKILAAARRMGIKVEEFAKSSAKGDGSMTEPVKVDDKPVVTPKPNGEGTVTKEQHDALTVQLTKEREDREKAEKRIADLEEINKTADFLHKAEGYKHISVPTADLAKMIRVMDDAKIDWKTHFDKLEAEGKESTLLKQQGADGEGSESVEGETPFLTEVNKRVKERVEKGIDKRSAEAIFADVVGEVQRADPNLYREHTQKMRERR